MTERRTSTEPSLAQKRLERLIGKVLSEQPPRSAPRTLESRVLAELERRAARPWWRNSFLHWPLPARLAFLLASFGVVKLALAAVMWVITDARSAPVVTALAQPLSWAEKTLNLFSMLGALGSAVLDAIPPHWLYAGLALAAALYIALFALGATAYRTLYMNK
jgi:hypothetical protein